MKPEHKDELQKFASEHDGKPLDQKALLKPNPMMAKVLIARILSMTPEQQQRYDANSPAAMQASQLKAQQQQQQQKFLQDQTLEDQKQLGKAGAEVLRSATEHAMDSEISGEPGNVGFGSTTTL